MQAAYSVDAAKTAGVGVHHTIMVSAWSKIVIGFFQPSWGLLLLCAANFEFHEVIGFSFFMYMVFTIVTSIGFMFPPFSQLNLKR
jgi:short subunit fatty acids transporter